MSKLKVLILGSTGFLGKNLTEWMRGSAQFEIITTSRKTDETRDNAFFFDFLIEDSWEKIINLKVDFVIDAAGYGVVKYENDLQKMYEINYLKPSKLFDVVCKKNPNVFWIQIGTAFEYDLTLGDLWENAPCVPRTHYGISKWLFSNYVQKNKISNRYLIIRPFGMFGPHEDESKLFPSLILSQLKKNRISLSSGAQIRDYVYVKDVVRLVISLLESEKHLNISKIINVGNKKEKSIKEIAEILSKSLKDFNPSLWGWNEIPQRKNENDRVVNASDIAYNLNLKITPFERAFSETIDYYKLIES